MEALSSAGQHDSFLNMVGKEQVLQAVKQVWASFFNERAIEYRNKNGIRHSEQSIAVVVQRMINGHSSGVGYNREPDSRTEGAFFEAIYGLGEPLVHGDVKPDRWFYDPTATKLIYQDTSIKRTKVISRLGGGKYEFDSPEAQQDKPVVISRLGSGVDEVDVPEAQQDKPVLGLKMANRVAAGMEAIKHHFKWDTDNEFVVDSRTGMLYYVQSRHDTRQAQETVKRVPTKDRSTAKFILSGGTKAYSGVGTGRLLTFDLSANPTRDEIRRLDEQVGRGDILVAPKTVPDLVTVLSRLGGLVTEEGGATSHASMVAHEFHIPALVGISRAVEIAKPYAEQVATLDATSSALYLGSLPTEEVARSSLTLFNDRDLRLNQEGLIKMLGPKDSSRIIYRPFRPHGVLQLELYRQAFYQMGKILDIQSSDIDKNIGVHFYEEAEATYEAQGKKNPDFEYRGKWLYTLEGFNTVVMNALRALPIDRRIKLMEDREEAVRRFMKLAMSFDKVTAETCQALFSAYVDVITYFNLRWVSKIEAEERYWDVMMNNIQAEHRDIVDGIRGQIVEQSETEAKRKEWRFAALLEKTSQHPLFTLSTPQDILHELSANKPVYRRFFESLKTFNTDFPSGDNDDLRLSEPDLLPLIKLLQRSQVKEQDKKKADVSRRTSPLLKEFPVIKLLAREALATEDEHTQLPRAQFRIRQSLLIAAEKLVAKGLLSEPMAIFEQTPEQVLKMLTEI
jgi:phosphohistidine swiveling domain-containing protein